MKITRKQLRRIIRESLWQDNYDSWMAQRDRERLEDAPVTGTYFEQGFEDALAGREDRYRGAADAGAQTNYEEYLKGYNEGLESS